jgi:hypothetical protein
MTDAASVAARPHLTSVPAGQRADLPNPGPAPDDRLTPEHRAYLNDAAITDTVLDDLGIMSARAPDGTVLGIAFPWVDLSGRRVVTMKPDHPRMERRPGKPDRPVKYEWPPKRDDEDHNLILWVTRDAGPDSPVLVVEGHKQSLAAASYAPDGYTVLGMNGCRGWTGCDLSWAYDRRVVVFLDSDAARNRAVFDAGTNLREALELEGAEFVQFARVPGMGTEGLDDHLAKLPLERRTERMAKLIDRAKAKPADRAPTGRGSRDDDPDDGGSTGGPTGPPPDPSGRPTVIVNADRHLVLNQLTDALVARWDATRLFCYGGALAKVDGASTVPLSPGMLLDIVSETAATYSVNAKGEANPEWPDSKTMSALFSRASRFSPLERVVQTPFVRPDGTVCSDPGYDVPTATFAALRDDVVGLTVPESPTPADVQAAVALLLDDWLGDMPWRTQASRAGALALILTPFIRGLVPLVPQAVVSAKQMGSGKNLLGDCLSILWTGQAMDPLPYNDTDEETRKTITSVFRGGSEVVCFDEAHEVGSKALARAITAVNYSDRVLGVSEMCKYPNRVTWMSLGNGVVVNGDMGRRVHFIELWPAVANPQDRDPDEFRHSDLREWTEQNRAALVRAALVLVRAWFAAGCPRGVRKEAMGSFEAWDRMISGILALAGVEGFLAELKAKRSESDHTGSGWEAHLAWLWDTFGLQEFQTKAVKAAALATPDVDSFAGAPPDGTKPGLYDPLAKDFTRELGSRYNRINERVYGGYQLVKTGESHGHVAKWSIRRVQVT